ncbi:MAG: Rid family detoxifying hydrolase [Candidatus Kariarchaeum pelagius]
MNEIVTDKAPGALGPYSQGIIFQNLIFTSGQICLDPVNGDLKNDNIENEVKQIMANLKAILEKGGGSFKSVIKTTIYLSDMKYYYEVNKLYASYFDGRYPARTTVAVSLPMDANVEIDMIAIKDN